MANVLEKLNNIRGSPYRNIDPVILGNVFDAAHSDTTETVTFYTPRPILKTNYEDNITVENNGRYPLPILAYRAYKSIYGEDAVRLYWVIMEFSGIKSIRDIQIGTRLVFPSLDRIKSIIK